MVPRPKNAPDKSQVFPGFSLLFPSRKKCTPVRRKSRERFTPVMWLLERRLFALKRKRMAARNPARNPHCLLAILKVRNPERGLIKREGIALRRGILIPKSQRPR